MSGPRKFFGGRIIANRTTFDRINPKFVPPSRHAIFIRGFPSDVDNHKIRDFFQDAAKSSCGIDFTSYNEDQRKLSIALRFESHEIAKEMVLRFNNSEIFGHRVDVTWFKDLKKARDRMIDERRAPYDDNRMNYNKNSRFDYDRRDNRDWSDNRNRYQPNNNNRSKSLEKGRDNSDMSYGNHKQSSEYERSPTIQSGKSESGSEFHERQTLPLKQSLIGSSDKPSAYRVDLDESLDSVLSVKPAIKIERSFVQTDNLPEEGLYKTDLDEKKKKKKKRKRRHMDHSGSQESYTETTTKMLKYNDQIEKIENTQFSAIAGDLNNWKQTASDSDDYLGRNNQISKPKALTLLSRPDSRLTNERNLKLLRLKLDSIEKAYKKDSETYSSVINVLIRTLIFI